MALYAAATRPAFRSVTLAGALISADGLNRRSQSLGHRAVALVAHARRTWSALLRCLERLGCRQPVAPVSFTGGSRFIQNGVLSCETRRYGFGLLAAVVSTGLCLAHSAGGPVWIGLAKLACWWPGPYSAPPLQLIFALGAGG
jgi:1,4-dihydroxy-2-naphthoate octaprenyltransferase